jgi:putative hydrolase of the HAD superfamily
MEPVVKQVRAVIFDFGGVLCFHPDQARWERAAQAAGLPVSEFMSAFWTNRIRYDAGLCQPAEYWQAVARTAGTRFDEQRLPTLIRSEIELWNRYDARVFTWIDDLRTAGFRTAILSNLPDPLGKELRATPGFLDHFDHVTFSYELGVVKPQPEIYLDTIRGLDLPPGQALFLDDRPDNIEGARATGLHAQVYSDWEDFNAAGLPARYGLPVPGLAEDVARRQ